MSYLVLARKYRPRSFSEMVGQEHVVQALGNALTQQRLHHAYLFTGTRGVGKTTVSRILAKSLNCTGPDGQGDITAEPCGVCPACRDIDSGRYVDYVELDAASNRGVEEISQLLDQAVYKPVAGRFKVYLIDEVHMLSTTAFNAMLKTLEEPPEYLKFVLATTDPQKVPVTVLSRCLQFNLRPMAPQTIFEHLGHVLAAESIAAEPGALRLLSRAAQGSMRDALSLTDQAIAYGGGTLDEAGVRRMLGAVDRSHVVRIVEALAAGDGRAMIGEVDALRAQGLSAGGTLEELAQLAQQMALLQAVPDAADPTDPDTPTVQRLAPLLPADEVQLLYSLALHGRTELGLAPDEYGALQMVLLRLLAFRPQGGGAVVSRTQGAAGSAGSAGSTAAHAAPMPAPAVPLRELPREVPRELARAAAPEVRPPAPTPARLAELAPVPAPVPAPVAAAVPPSPAPVVTEARPAFQPRPLLATRPADTTARSAPVAPLAAASVAPTAPAARIARPEPVRSPPPAEPAPRPAPPRSSAPSFDEPPWMADEPPPEDLPGGAGGTPRWDDEPAARPSSSPSNNAARPNRPLPATRGRAPLLAPSSAAQARVMPREIKGDAAGVAPLASARAPASAPPAEDESAAPAAAPARVDATVAEVPAAPAVTELVLDPLTDRWLAVLQPLLGRLTGFARELGWQAQCIDFDEVAQPLRLVLRVERESLRQGSHRERLQAALAEQLGAPVQLEVEAGRVSDSAARRDAAERARIQAEAEAAIRTDPLVLELMQRFPGARLVPNTIRPIAGGGGAAATA